MGLPRTTGGLVKWYKTNRSLGGRHSKGRDCRSGCSQQGWARMNDSTIALYPRPKVIEEHGVVLHHPTDEAQRIGRPSFHKAVDREGKG